MKNTERFYYIGDHIRRLRESKGWTQQGWTQQELGKRLGKKTSTISAYETNAKLPSAECLIEMAELFGISLDTLIYGENAELLSVRSLSQEQKGLVSALAEYFGTEPTRQKSIELRWFLITELIRLLNQ